MFSISRGVCVCVVLEVLMLLYNLNQAILVLVLTTHSVNRLVSGEHLYPSGRDRFTLFGILLKLMKKEAQNGNMTKKENNQQ